MNITVKAYNWSIQYDMSKEMSFLQGKVKSKKVKISLIFVLENRVTTLNLDGIVRYMW
jgi:hypothetical protein